MKGIVFDIDGTLLRAHRLLPGAAELLAELGRRGIAFLCLTNDSQETPAAWAGRFHDLGIDMSPDQVITAAEIAAETALQAFPKGKIFPVGDPALIEALQARGLELVQAPNCTQADLVVMGMDSDFDQQRLYEVCKQIWGGASFLATNDDRRRPAETGYVPGTGPMVKAVAWATGVDPVVVGKPAKTAAETALRRLGLSPGQTVMVGDRPETDIAMGKAVGMTTVLVVDRDKSRDDIAPQKTEAAQPDATLFHLMDLLVWLDGGH